MTISDADKHHGPGRIEAIPPEARADAALAERFRFFAREECSGQSGLGVRSPTYAILSETAAADSLILRLARECQLGQPIPNLFLSAVKRVAADRAESELARAYAAIAAGADPTNDLPAKFARFCASHESEIIDLVKTRRVQTNEIRRCAYLMPSFAAVSADSGGKPLALIDVGASAGLNLIWDRYSYAYSDGSRYGPSESPVIIESCLRSPMPDIPPDIPDEFPSVAFRIGIDIAPVDLADAEQFAWMQALVWPDHPDRAALLIAARRLCLQSPPTLLAGDALDILPRALRMAPKDAALCVFHCHTLNQFPREARSEFYEILTAESMSRTVYHLPSEGERMSLDKIDRGKSVTVLSAKRNAHGRWIEWDRRDTPPK